ncbi:hypothetical protein GF342_00960 [Candidatus Woesearchaeota archaeon]|nr:hypothetical protein [Candidatus Woesearchaeota archaeon]
MTEPIRRRLAQELPPVAFDHLLCGMRELHERAALYEQAQTLAREIGSTQSTKRLLRLRHRAESVAQSIARAGDVRVDAIFVPEERGLDVVLPIRSGDAVSGSLPERVYAQTRDAVERAYCPDITDRELAGFLSIFTPLKDLEKMHDLQSTLWSEPRLNGARVELMGSASLTGIPVYRKDLEEYARELPVRHAAVHQGAINVLSAHFANDAFLPENEDFGLTDYQGNQWNARVASYKISEGVTSLVRRENGRFAQQGASPLAVGDRMWILRLPDKENQRDFYIQMHKPRQVSTPHPSLEFPVLPTLIDYGCINVRTGDRQFFGQHPFEFRDRSGVQWPTRLRGGKISIGIGKPSDDRWTARECDRLAAHGGVQPGDIYRFERVSNGTAPAVYTIEVLK